MGLKPLGYVCKDGIAKDGLAITDLDILDDVKAVMAAIRDRLNSVLIKRFKLPCDDAVYTLKAVRRIFSSAEIQSYIGNLLHKYKALVETGKTPNEYTLYQVNLMEMLDEVNDIYDSRKLRPNRTRIEFTILFNHNTNTPNLEVMVKV